MPTTPLPITILAGGLATRLRPVTEKIPKALIDINGQPFIHHQLRLLQQAGLKHVVLCVGYLGEMVREFVADGLRYGLRVDYVFDGPKLLGTAGALKRAMAAVGGLREAGAFFTLYGDSYLPCDYLSVQGHFERSGKDALMTVYRNEGLFDTSNVELRAGGEGSGVSSGGAEILVYDKKNRTPRMRHIDYGLGIFQTAAFEAVPEGTVFDLATLYQMLLAQGRLTGYEIPERFYEIGSFSGIEETKAYIAGHPVGE